MQQPKKEIDNTTVSYLVMQDMNIRAALYVRRYSKSTTALDDIRKVSNVLGLNSTLLDENKEWLKEILDTHPLPTDTLEDYQEVDCEGYERIPIKDFGRMIVFESQNNNPGELYVEGVMLIADHNGKDVLCMVIPFEEKKRFNKGSLISIVVNRGKKRLL